ncbi:MAG: hypothetical protein HQL52_14460 [Magnetococcales bacterium]|nr:hypothetical protein [Magnetococcales bacterium]
MIFDFRQLTAKLVLLMGGVACFTWASPAYAYVGPGAGLGMVGSLVAVVVAVVLGVVGFVLYPIRLIMKKRKQASENQAKEASAVDPESDQKE